LRPTVTAEFLRARSFNATVTVELIERMGCVIAVALAHRHKRKVVAVR
jgi:hypothetical protein